MNAALGQIEKNWGGTCSRVNQLAWKGKSKKLQNMEGKKLGIHLKILASCRGYVSNCLSAGSLGLHRLMSDAFVLCSKSQPLFAVTSTSATSTLQWFEEGSWLLFVLLCMGTFCCRIPFRYIIVLKHYSKPLSFKSFTDLFSYSVCEAKYRRAEQENPSVRCCFCGSALWSKGELWCTWAILVWRTGAVEW